MSEPVKRYNYDVKDGYLMSSDDRYNYAVDGVFVTAADYDALKAERDEFFADRYHLEVRLRKTEDARDRLAAVVMIARQINAGVYEDTRMTKALHLLDVLDALAHTDGVKP